MRLKKYIPLVIFLLALFSAHAGAASVQHGEQGALRAAAATPLPDTVSVVMESMPAVLNDSLLQTIDAALAAAMRVRSDSVSRVSIMSEAKLSVEERNRRFYDSLAAKSNRNAFSRLLHRLLIRSSGGSGGGNAQAVDAAEPYREFEGKTIGEITYARHNMYENPTKWHRKVGNALHTPTRVWNVKRDILFKTGQAVDPDIMALNKQLLISREYLYDAQIELTPVPGDSTSVDVKITTRDKWSIGADGSIAGLSGRVTGTIYDANLFGSGNKFKYKLSGDWKRWDYQGSMFEYYVPNLFGSFYTANLTAGRSFRDTRYTAATNKPIIRPGDYGAGAEYLHIDAPYYMLYVNDGLHNKSADIKYNSLDIWGGKSFRLRKKESNIYALARVYGIRYDRRAISDGYEEPLPPLEVGYWKNPGFHNRMLYLVTAGLYREEFRTATLIYGYGFTEYVPVGYNTELIGGWMQGEFESGPYAGLRLKAGSFSRAGYFMGELSLGSYYDTARDRLFQSSLNFRLHYFTNLLSLGRRVGLRQFVTLNYVRGWNREEGVDEWIRLTRENGPRDISVYTYGRQRAVLSAETVLFTRWQPLGFRTAVYAFGDVAFIGDRGNMFRNDFYSAIGVGVRMKNERFVFSTLQLSFSLAFGRKGLVHNNWAKLATEQRMQSQRYIPGKPQPADYR